MSCFLVLNFQDFGLNQDITKSIQSQTFFCICCLEKSGPLLDLATCTHARYLDTFSKPELEQYKQVVCYQCHRILMKIEQFRQQVLSTFNILLSETFNPKDYRKIETSTLKISKTIDILLPPPIVESPDDTQPDSTEKDLNLDTQEKDPLAFEEETQLDKEDSFPKSLQGDDKNQNDTDDRRRLKKKDKRQSVIIKSEYSLNVKNEPISLEMDYRGNDSSQLETLNKAVRVKMVKLTKEQLMNERVQEAQSASYLNYKYRCEYCIVGFNYEENVKDHMLRRHGPKLGSITCEICLQVLYPPGSLSAHNFRHYTRYDCEMCSKRFSIFDDALHHFRKEHEKKHAKYKCRLCNFSTDQQNKYKYHRIEHKKYVCKDCGLVLPSLTSLRRHLMSVHNKTVHKCHVCHKACESRRAAARHARTHGGASRCEHCDLQFKSWNAYNAHMKFSSVHMKNKYKCDDCGMVFGAANHLRQHARMKHSKKYPYMCPRCPKAFSFAKEMKLHLRGHTSKGHGDFEIIICDYCGEAYKSRRHLIRHIAIHTKSNKQTATAHTTTAVHQSADG